MGFWMDVRLMGGGRGVKTNIIDTFKIDEVIRKAKNAILGFR